MKGKDSSDNKGFAFVTFRSVDLATKAIGELNNTEFKVNVLTFLCLW
jgi:heterogeneous nuclear ribonucleoprotein R